MTKIPANRALAKGAPKNIRIDNRADQVLAAIPDGDDDDLFTTEEMARWWRCSIQWFELGRAQGYGPPYTRLGPRMVRYSKAKAREYLAERAQAAIGFNRRQSAA